MADAPHLTDLPTGSGFALNNPASVCSEQPKVTKAPRLRDEVDNHKSHKEGITRPGYWGLDVSPEAYEAVT